METSFEITGRGGITLRPLQPDNAPAMAAIANDASIAAFLRDIFPHPYTLQHAQDYIRMAAGDNLLYSWGIFEHNVLAGVISLTRGEDIYRHTAEIGYWLGKTYRGRGIGREVIGLVCEYGFNQLNVVRIFANIFENNDASHKVLLANGFTVEGIGKKGALKHQQLLDVYLMAKVK